MEPRSWRDHRFRVFTFIGGTGTNEVTGRWHAVRVHGETVEDRTL